MQFEQAAQGAVGTQFAAIPLELRQRRQWVVWRAVVHKNKEGVTGIAKHPFRGDDPSVPADVSYPHTWVSFEEAVACYLRHSSVVSGIGYVLTAEDPYIVFDIDDPKRKPRLVQGYRDEFLRRIGHVNTLVMQSPSGEGFHVWMRGRMSSDSRELAELGAEVYQSRRFMTVTGQVVSQTAEINNGQGFIDTIGLGAQRPSGQLGDDISLPLDLSDEEVLRRATAYASSFANQFAGRDLAPHRNMPNFEDWSATYLAVLGVLTKTTGSIHQIYRLVTSSGLALDCEPHPNGEARISKVRRLFAEDMVRVRGELTVDRYFINHGKQQWENICQDKERRAAEAARLELERVAAEEAAAAAYKAQMERLGAAGIVVEGYSVQAEAVLKQFPMLTWEHRKLTPPPGIAGKLVLAVTEASYIPDLYFSIPTTLSAISGIVGRSYRPDRGGSLNLNFFMLGKPGTGKTSALDAWRALVAEAIANPPPQMPKRGNIQGPLKDYMIREKASSAHGLHLSIQATPCAMWCIDEAAQQYSLISDSRDKIGQGIQGVVNELYDAGRYGKRINPPSSMSTRNANMVPIDFPSISTLWACPPDKIDISADAIVSGLLSRLLVIKNPSDGKEEADDVDARPLAFNPDLKLLVVELLSRAGDFDFYYKTPNVQFDPATVIIDTSQVQYMARAVAKAASRINIMANKHTLPAHYSVFIRMAQHVMRMACILAIIENRYMPAVTEDMYRWAAGYVIQNMLLLASGMDSGEVGTKASDEWLAVKRCFLRLRKEGKHRDTLGVTRGALLDAMKSHKVFYDSKLGGSKAATACLDLMIKEGVLDQRDANVGKPGRPSHVLYAISDHELWTM